MKAFFGASIAEMAFNIIKAEEEHHHFEFCVQFNFIKYNFIARSILYEWCFIMMSNIVDLWKQKMFETIFGNGASVLVQFTR